MWFRRLCKVPFLAVVAVASSVTPLKADEFKVLESSAPNIKAGTTLSHDTRLNIPDGAELRLQKIPGDSMQHRIVGPSEGTFASYYACGGLKRMFGLCPATEDEPIGGTRAPPPR